MARSLRRQVGVSVSGAYRGVSLSGLEFAATTLPGVQGTNYTKFSNAHYSYIAGKGFNVVRLAVLWERLQTNVTESLNATYKGYIDENIAWAKANGLKIALNIHNFGRRDVGGASQIIDDGTLTKEHFADLWDKLSEAYKDEDGVLAYGLMNEPHDMPNADSWDEAAQLAIDTIRANGDNKIITVAMGAWSSIRELSIPNINDSNYWLEGHLYFDSDNTGTYTNATGTHFTGSGKTMGEAGDALIALYDQVSVPIFVGEYGIPTNDQGYLTALNDFMNVMDMYGIHGTYWAMGSWYSSATSCHPKNSYTDDREQMDIIVKHL